MMAIIDGQVPQADDTPSPVRVVIKLTEVAQRKRLDGESREGDRLLDELRKVLPDAEMKPYFSEDEDAYVEGGPGQ